MINDLTRNIIKNFNPYKVNNDEAKIILDANESPFDLSKEVKDKISNMINGKTELNRYPDTSSIKLRKSLAEKYGCGIENIVIGTGSDQIITMLIDAFIDPGDVVLSPAPSFDMYKVTSEIGLAKVLEYELDPSKDYIYDVDKIIDLISVHTPKLIFLCTPNNPTGNAISNDDIERILKKAKKSIVVIDEAYVEFSDTSFTSKVLRYENAIALRTFSKAYGLAGLRCGYSISSSAIVDQLLKVIPPYNISRFSQDAARFVLEAYEVNETRINYIKKERERVFEALKGLKELKIYPSVSNFYLLKSMNGIDLYKELLKRGIRIRKYSGKKGLENCYRITIGTDVENDKVIKSIYEVSK